MLFSLLEEHIGPGTDRHVGRGMALWRILVMGVLKQGLGCDFDRVQELANQHRTVREFLGQRLRRTRSTNCKRSWTSVDPGAAVGGRGSRGGEWASGGGKPGEPLRGRCDSFVVETNVHYPTDVGLLWAMPPGDGTGGAGTRGCAGVSGGISAGR